MANQEHLDILKQGVKIWNQSRQDYPKVLPDLSEAYLKGANLREANLSGADLSRANLFAAAMRFIDLNGAHLSDTDFSFADLSNANLKGAILSGAKLMFTKLNYADLSNANLNTASLIYTNLSHAVLNNCSVFGISVWNVNLEGAIQTNLEVGIHVYTPGYETPVIYVDDLKVAQFLFLLLDNREIGNIIDTISSKVVLILGRFTPERKAVLDAIRDELRIWSYVPVIFDFEKPMSRDFTETVKALAHLSRFIIADLTDPSSIPQELQAIVPDLEVPVQPLLLEEKREYSMFVDFNKYDWVLPVYLYKDQTSLIASLKDEVIEPADKKARELAVEKAKRLERP